MRNFRWLVASTFLAYTFVAFGLFPTRASAAIGSWREALTFYASFDEQADANVAAGDAKIYTATDLSRKQSTPGLSDKSVHLAADGRWGKCLMFADTTSSVVFFRGADNMPYATDSHDATISFWVRLDPDKDLKPGYVDPLQITDKQWNNASLFVDFTKDDTPRHFRLGVFPDYTFWNPQDTPWDDVAESERPMVTVTKPSFSSDRWTHVVIVLHAINSPDQAEATLYLDGSSQGTLKRPQQFTWDPEQVAIMLGIQYIGKLDDFAIFRGAMPPDAVQSLYQLKGGMSTLLRDADSSDAHGTNAPTTDASRPSTSPEESDSTWKPLFNGRDLEGWQIKIRGYELGNNFGNTFRVANGVIQVGYEGYSSFNEQFGHLFYEQPFSSYDLRVEYRFVGNQAPDGPGWAFRNSGIMVHGQDPATMAIDQQFPCSIEVQLLGGGGRGDRTTANLCTPGTHVVMDDKLVTRHCTNSTSKTYHGDQWVTLVVKVRGNEVIEHVIDGETVLKYEKPQLDPGDADAARLLATQFKMLDRGTISLQSESHPVEFRKVEIRELD
jgi:hypothetical protein